MNKPVLTTDETLGNFLSRSATQRIQLGVPVLDRTATFNRTDVVEVCGPAGTGKTEFLYAASLAHIMRAPTRHIIYLDLDYKFEPYRVQQLLHCLLEQEANLQPTAPAIAEERERTTQLHRNVDLEERRRQRGEEVSTTLERLHVFSCTSSLQFLATLKVLGTEFVPSLYERGGSLGAIIVDNVSSYWDVLKETKKNQTGFKRAGKGRDDRDQPQHSVIEAIVHSLSELRDMCDVPVLVSRRTAREEFHDVGNRVWNDFVVKRASLACGVFRQQKRAMATLATDEQKREMQGIDVSQMERTIRWVKGVTGSTPDGVKFTIHPNLGVHT